MIELQGIRKTYRQGTQDLAILLDVNYRIAAGEAVAVVGESGSGKSTLLSLIAGLLRPTAGTIRVDGQELNLLNEVELARFRAHTLGMVFQQFHLMPYLNALENVSLPLEIAGVRDYRVRAEHALDEVGLAARARHLPHQLSGGECQRVAIARALVGQPKLILADEPSGNLDPQTGSRIATLLFELVKAKRATLVLVTHNQALAAHCDRVAQLNNGRLT